MKNVNPARLVEVALQQTKDIARDGDDFLITRGDSVARFSTEALQAFHPDLATALNYVLLHHPNNAAKVMRQTLAHWRNPMPPHEGYPRFFLNTIQGLCEASVFEGSFVVKASRYKTETVQPGLDIAVFTNVAKLHTVSEAWLEQYYPGLADKYRVLKALGLDDKEIDKQVCHILSTAVASADISNLTFDE